MIELLAARDPTSVGTNDLVANPVAVGTDAMTLPLRETEGQRETETVLEKVARTVGRVLVMVPDTEGVGNTEMDGTTENEGSGERVSRNEYCVMEAVVLAESDIVNVRMDGTTVAEGSGERVPRNENRVMVAVLHTLVVGEKEEHLEAERVRVRVTVTERVRDVHVETDGVPE